MAVSSLKRQAEGRDWTDHLLVLGPTVSAILKLLAPDGRVVPCEPTVVRFHTLGVGTRLSADLFAGGVEAKSVVVEIVVRWLGHGILRSADGDSALARRVMDLLA